MLNSFLTVASTSGVLPTGSFIKKKKKGWSWEWQVWDLLENGGSFKSYNGELMGAGTWAANMSTRQYLVGDS